MRRFPLVVCLLVAACPPAVRQPASADLVVLGSVTWGGFDRRADPLDDVVVRLSSGQARVADTSNATGDYRLQLPAAEPGPVTLTAWRRGFAPLLRTLRVGTRTELQQSFALTPLEKLDCLDTQCVSGTGDVRWTEAPSAASASAVILDEAPTLSSPAVLLTAVALEVDAPSLPGTIRVRLGPAAWRDVVDVRPGSGAIELSTGVLGPDDATWRPAAVAQLRTEAGVVIPESQLARVRSGQFPPGVVAEVTPLSRGVIGVFGGQANRGCVEGSVLIDGQPTAGVTLFPDEGVPASSATSGAVCLEVPVGTEPRRARVQYAGVGYASLTLPAATQPGSCGQGCIAMGPRAVRTDAVATAAPCRVQVKVVDESNQPLAQAVVIGMDDSLTQATFTQLCGRMGTRCTLTGATDAMGLVSLVVPSQLGLTLSARSNLMGAARAGSTQLAACPTDVVSVTARRGRDLVQPVARFLGQQVSWTPNAPAFRLRVERDGGVVWSVRSFSGLTSPVTVGASVPNGEVETAPVTSAQPGDVGYLFFDGVGPTGIAVEGSTSAVSE